jgi:hypothetical protein
MGPRDSWLTVPLVRSCAQAGARASVFAFAEAVAGHVDGGPESEGTTTASNVGFVITPCRPWIPLIREVTGESDLVILPGRRALENGTDQDGHGARPVITAVQVA